MNQINYGSTFSKSLSDSLSKEISSGFEFEVGFKRFNISAFLGLGHNS